MALAETGTVIIFQSIGTAVTHIFNAELGEAVTALSGAIVGLSVFFIIFALFNYIARITLFREKEHHKWASWMSVGIALIAISTPQLYKFITGIAGVGVMILFAILMIFLMIVGFKRMSTSSAEAGTELATQQKRFFKARGESRRERHDLSVGAHNLETEDINLGKANSRLRSMKRNESEGEELLKEIERAVSLAVSMQSEGKNVQEAKQRILDQVNTFVSRIKVEHKDLGALRSELKVVRKLDIRDTKTETDEIATAARMRKDIQRQTGQTMDMIKTESHQISELAKMERQLSQESLQLDTDIMRTVQQADQNVNAIVHMQKKLSGALSPKGRVEDAVPAIGELRQHLQIIKQDNAQIEKDLARIRGIKDQSSNLQTRMSSLLSTMKKFEKRETKEIKKEVKEAPKSGPPGDGS